MTEEQMRNLNVRARLSGKVSRVFYPAQIARLWPAGTEVNVTCPRCSQTATIMIEHPGISWGAYHFRCHGFTAPERSPATGCPIMMHVGVQRKDAVGPDRAWIAVDEDGGMSMQKHGMNLGLFTAKSIGIAPQSSPGTSSLEDDQP